MRLQSHLDPGQLGPDRFMTIEWMGFANCAFCRPERIGLDRQSLAPSPILAQSSTIKPNHIKGAHALIRQGYEDRGRPSQWVAPNLFIGVIYKIIRIGRPRS